MKLLFDENLSPRLVAALASEFPESAHVHEVGLGAAADEAVWNFARDSDFVIVSKDSDFAELSVLRGAPPRLVWIRRGNCSTSDIASLLRAHRAAIDELAAAATARIYIIE